MWGFPRGFPNVIKLLSILNRPILYTSVGHTQCVAVINYKRTMQCVHLTITEICVISAGNSKSDDPGR